MSSSMRLALVMFMAALGFAVSDRMMQNLAKAAVSDADVGDRSAEAAKGAALLADQIRAGSLFLGRFRMKQALWARSLDKDRRQVLLPLPSAMKDRFTGAKELLSGSFGETWAAYDQQTKRFVALKIFYSTDARGNRYHLTWDNVAGNEDATASLASAAGECLTARKMQIFAGSDPVGASRLMQCYEDHVTCDACRDGEASGWSSSAHEVKRDQALYQVLEDCTGVGGLPLNQWIEKEKSGPFFRDDGLRLFKQLMQGLNYLTAPGHSVKWGHHDLKPDNIVVKRQNGEVHTKIIDFGSVTEITPDLATGEPFATTATYAPVEYFGHWRFDSESPWSYDMYAAGCTLHHMFTGNLTAVALFMQIPESMQHDIEKQCGEDPQCLVTFGLGTLKRRVEPFLSQDWGKNKSAVPVARAMLFDSQIVEPAFEEHAKFFLSKDGFLDMLVAMLSAVPAQRPTPRQVLVAPFMEWLPAEADPQFDARHAQTMAELTYSSTGVEPSEVFGASFVQGRQTPPQSTAPGTHAEHAVHLHSG